jgi:hypothetical protein
MKVRLKNRIKRKQKGRVCDCSSCNSISMRYPLFAEVDMGEFIRVWRLDLDEMVLELGPYEWGNVAGIALSPAGKYLAMRDHAGSTEVHELGVGDHDVLGFTAKFLGLQEVCEIDCRGFDRYWFISDDELLFLERGDCNWAESREGRITVCTWDIHEEQTTKNLEFDSVFHDCWAFDLSLSRKEVTGCVNGRVNILNCVTGSRLVIDKRIHRRGEYLESIDRSDDGKRVCYVRADYGDGCGHAGEICVLDLLSRKTLAKAFLPKFFGASAKFVEGHPLVAIAYAEFDRQHEEAVSLRVYDYESNKNVFEKVYLGGDIPRYHDEGAMNLECHDNLIVFPHRTGIDIYEVT